MVWMAHLSTVGGGGALEQGAAMINFVVWCGKDLAVSPARNKISDKEGSTVTRRFVLPIVAAAVILFPGMRDSASAGVGLVKISSDPFTNTTSQHATEVEPDTFAFGTTIVSAFQAGRFFDGGASD